MSAPVSLSVAIVTYRTEAALLSRALGSLADAAREARDAGALDSIRVFVIENGDAAPDVSAWPGDLGTIEVSMGHGNIGYGRANNLVMQRLRSELHLVMNPDVEVDRDALRAGLEALAKHPEVGLVAPDVLDGEGNRQYLCKRYPSAWVLLLRGFAPRALQRRFRRALDRYEMRDVVGARFAPGIPLASGAFMLVRTELFLRIGGFDPRFFMYFEDYDLSIRLGREAAIAYSPDMRITHHGGEASRKGVRHVAWFTASAAKFFARHGWRRG